MGEEARGYVVQLRLTLDVRTDGPPHRTDPGRAIDQARDLLRVINKGLGRDKLALDGVFVRRMTEGDE